MGGDSPQYITQCDLWRRDVAGAAASFVGLEYSGFTLPMCSVLALTGGSFAAWVLVQVLLSSAAAGFLCDATRRIFGDASGILAGLAQSVLYETFQWDVYILSDSVFVSLLIVTLWATVWALASPKPARLALVGGLLLLVAITRPGGFLYSVGWLCCSCVILYRRGGPRLMSARRAVAGVSLAAVAAIVLAAGPLASRIRFYARVMPEKLASGVVISDDPGWDAPGAGPITILARRVGALWLPFVFRFSVRHAGMNVVVLVPIFLLGLAGMALSPRRPEAWVVMVPIGVVHLCVLAIFVDWDWRYRAPMMPSLVVFAAATVGPRVGYVAKWLRLPAIR